MEYKTEGADRCGASSATAGDAARYSCTATIVVNTQPTLDIFADSRQIFLLLSSVFKLRVCSKGTQSIIAMVHIFAPDCRQRAE